MTHLSALCTSDPSLVACELERLRAGVDFPLGGVAGLGAYADDQVVLKRFGQGVPRDDMWEVPESVSVLICAEDLAVGEGLEESSQPFRFRQWLFGFTAAQPVPLGLRDVLVANLPEFLARGVKGRTVGEAAFFTFLSGLRELGRLEDPTVDSTLAAKLLATAAQKVSERAQGLGVAMVATNGVVTAAGRQGSVPLHYALLEGDPRCVRCENAKGHKSTESLERDHKRRRSVVMTTHPKPGPLWIEFPPGAALAVDKTLAAQRIGFR